MGREESWGPPIPISRMIQRMSAHVSDALLGCFLSWRFLLCRKLKQLTLMQVRQQNKHAIWKFECVMMHLWCVLVDLPKDAVLELMIAPPIYWARLRRVYYANTRADASQIGFDDGFIYSEVARVPELRKIPHLRLVTDNAQMAFTEWACSPEKIRY